MAVPVAIPLTRPVLLTVAIPVALLLHEPPVVASDNEVTAPVHTDVTPVMALTTGSGLMVTTMVVRAVPQALVTE